MTEKELFKLANPEMLVELSRNEIIFVTPDEEVVFMNPKALRLRGLPQNFDYKKTSLSRLYSNGTEIELRKVLAQLRTKKTIYTDLCTVNEATNEIVYLDSRVNTISAKDNSLQGFAIISYNISSEVLARKELTKSQNHLLSIIKTASDGIITLDSSGLIQSINRAAATLFGYEPEEMEGANISKLMPISNEENRAAYIKKFLKSKEGRAVGREVEGINKDGTIIPFRLSISKVNVGEEIFFTGIVHDLTEEKQAEKSLKELNRDLEKRVKDRTEELADTVNKLLKEISERKSAQLLLVQNEVEIKNALKKEKELSDLKSRFISTASHEFRTPLAAIGLSASLIGKYNDINDKGAEKREKHINRIQSNVETITDILNDFLSMSRLEEGKLEQNPKSFNLKLLSEGIVNDLTGFKKPNQQIYYTHIGEEIEIYLDPHLLKNVIINLLSNAVKYSKEDGDIYFQTEISTENISISVKDNGIGIPKKEQKFLFDRFFRAHNAANIQGTGIGLNIVKQYVEIMSGNITFESIEGKGAIFLIKIPRQTLQISG